MRTLFSVFLIFLPLTLLADEGALLELSRSLRTMGSYESAIIVEMQGSRLEGHYRISGEDYHIDLGSVEMWGEGDKRYEVSHKMEEIVIERAEADGATLLLKNPARAFELVGQGFDVQKEGATLLLTPKQGEAKVDVDRIIIEIDNTTQLPRKITYEADRDRATVEFGGITKSTKPLGKFNPSRYKKYEVVDLYK